MKKIFCLGLLICGLVSFSQVREKNTIEVAPIVGYATANYYGNNLEQYDGISSVHYGANVDYYFHNRWSVRSGLLIQTMGSEYDMPGDILGAELTPGNVEEKLTYLTIPVNANWHFGKTRKWNLNFGPSIGFLMSAETNGKDVKQYVNSTQYGFNFGIGYKIAITEKIGILIDHQEMLGLSKVSKAGSSNFKNIYGSFNVGCVIKL